MSTSKCYTCDMHLSDTCWHCKTLLLKSYSRQLLPCHATQDAMTHDLDYAILCNRHNIAIMIAVISHQSSDHAILHTTQVTWCHQSCHDTFISSLLSFSSLFYVISLPSWCHCHVSLFLSHDAIMPPLILSLPYQHYNKCCHLLHIWNCQMMPLLTATHQ